MVAGKLKTDGLHWTQVSDLKFLEFVSGKNYTTSKEFHLLS